MSIWWRQVSCWYCVALILNFPFVEHRFCIPDTGTPQRRSNTCNIKVDASVLCGSEHVSSTTAWYNQIHNYCWQPTNFTSSRTLKTVLQLTIPFIHHIKQIINTVDISAIIMSSHCSEMPGSGTNLSYPTQETPCSMEMSFLIILSHL
jgi:hypothetical protein